MPAASTPASARGWPDLAPPPPVLPDLSLVGISLLLCLALAVAVILWLHRRKQAGSAAARLPAQLQSLASLPLGRHGTLYLVRCQAHTLLIAADARGIVSVSTLAPAGVAAAEPLA